MHVALIAPTLPVHCHGGQSVCHGAYGIGGYIGRCAARHGLNDVERLCGLQQAFSGAASGYYNRVARAYGQTLALHAVHVDLHLPNF